MKSLQFGEQDITLDSKISLYIAGSLTILVIFSIFLTTSLSFMYEMDKRCKATRINLIESNAERIQWDIYLALCEKK